MESSLQRVVQGFSCRELFPHTGIDNDIRIYRHSYGKNDTGDARKGKGDVKRVQEAQIQEGEKNQRPPGDKS